MNGASGIGWDENSPADTESLGLGDDRIRSIKSSVRAGLDDEHNWSSSGGNGIGYHRYGSARPFFGTQSRVSSSGTDGRLMLTSDTSRLFGAGSGGTVFLGGSQVVSVATNADTAGGRHHWVEEFGIAVTGSGGTVTVTFPNSGYSGAPYIWLQLINHPPSQLSADVVLSVETTTNGTSVNVWAVASVNGDMNAGARFFWRSLGTRAL